MGPRPGWSSRRGSPRTRRRVTSPAERVPQACRCAWTLRRIPAITDNGQSEPGLKPAKCLSARCQPLRGIRSRHGFCGWARRRAAARPVGRAGAPPTAHRPRRSRLLPAAGRRLGAGRQSSPTATRAHRRSPGGRPSHWAMAARRPAPSGRHRHAGQPAPPRRALLHPHRPTAGTAAPRRAAAPVPRPIPTANPRRAASEHRPVGHCRRGGPRQHRPIPRTASPRRPARNGPPRQGTGPSPALPPRGAPARTGPSRGGTGPSAALPPRGGTPPPGPSRPGLPPPGATPPRGTSYARGGASSQETAPAGVSPAQRAVSRGGSPRRRGPIRGYPPMPGQPGPVYPPGQFSVWNRPSVRASWLGMNGNGDGMRDGEAEPGYSILATSDPSADATVTQTWAVIDETGGWSPPPPARDVSAHTDGEGFPDSAGGRAAPRRARAFSGSARTGGPQPPARPVGIRRHAAAGRPAAVRFSGLRPRVPAARHLPHPARRRPPARAAGRAAPPAVPASPAAAAAAAPAGAAGWPCAHTAP